MTAVSKENNILKIITPTKNYYFNAGWCTMDFTDEAVIITDEGKSQYGESVTILFTEFEDAGGTPYSTEANIVTYLSDKIG